ncbi:16494_t:CDS:1, partial [Dentiscutata erythropus]
MKFGPDVQITRRCFENILKIYVNIDQQIQGFNVDIPLGMSRTPFQEICDIFKTYCNTKNFFLPSHLDIVTQCINVEILIPLFKYYLPKLFNVEMTFVMPIIEVADNANHNTDIIQKSSTKKKENKLILEEWKQMLYNISISDESRSDVFQDYFREFIAKLPTS